MSYVMTDYLPYLFNASACIPTLSVLALRYFISNYSIVIIVFIVLHCDITLSLLLVY